MKPSTPFKSTTQVPDNILFALTKRQILNTEARVILAICAHSEKIPGKANVTFDQLAHTLGEPTARARQMIDGCVSRHLVNVQTVTTGPSGMTPNIFRVNSPSMWNVPG